MAMVSKKLNTNARPFFKRLLKMQLVRFGIVGATSALVNFLGVFALVELFSLKPLIANIIAYLIASIVSYVGHYHWTFASNAEHHKSVFKFYIMLGMNLLLNEALYAFFLYVVSLNYQLALILTIVIVPIFTFIVSKLWVYR
jgi:putative flippase GtrA